MQNIKGYVAIVIAGIAIAFGVHFKSNDDYQAALARDAIEMLSIQSGKVGKIVEVINEISGQINLLALNATIESARAGDAGKGGAVVASEVKQLATQVNKATEEISEQVTRMQSATQASVESVLQIISTIDEVSNNIQAVAAAVEEQSSLLQGKVAEFLRTVRS